MGCGDVKRTILRIIEEGQFATEYQPLLDVQTLETRGYEALARFVLDGESFPTDAIFDVLHDDRMLFFMLEARLKTFQIQHRPQGYPLFLNIDPDVCEEGYQLEHWLNTFSREPDITVEIIENTSVTNLAKIRSFVSALSHANIGVALDDLGGHRNLVSIDLLEHANVLKFDRSWLARISRQEGYRRLLTGLISFARASNIRCILEGVETQSDLTLARELGVDFAQGYLFREHFLYVR